MSPLDVELVVSRENLAPERKEKVITILRDLPASIALRRGFYHRWLSLVGLPITPEELNRIGRLPGQRRSPRE